MFARVADFAELRLCLQKRRVEMAPKQTLLVSFAGGNADFLLVLFLF